MTILAPPNRAEPSSIPGRGALDRRFARDAVKELTHLMRITKFEHAALRIQQGDDTLLIDPGSFTAPLNDLSGLVAVVITHEHPDPVSYTHLTLPTKA